MRKRGRAVACGWGRVLVLVPLVRPRACSMPRLFLLTEHFVKNKPPTFKGVPIHCDDGCWCEPAYMRLCFVCGGDGEREFGKCEVCGGSGLVETDEDADCDKVVIHRDIPMREM